MGKRNIRDIIAGGLLCSVGVFVAWYSQHYFSIRLSGGMGAGAFPLGVGALLAVFGFWILMSGILTREEAGTDKADYRAVALVTAGIGVFALLCDRLGLLPAVAAMAIASIPARSWRGWKFAAVLSAAMCAMAAGIFYYGLSMPFRLVWWE